MPQTPLAPVDSCRPHALPAYLDLPGTPTCCLLDFLSAAGILSVSCCNELGRRSAHGRCSSPGTVGVAPRGSGRCDPPLPVRGLLGVNTVSGTVLALGTHWGQMKSNGKGPCAGSSITAGERMTNRSGLLTMSDMVRVKQRKRAGERRETWGLRVHLGSRHKVPQNGGGNEWNLLPHDARS